MRRPGMREQDEKEKKGAGSEDRLGLSHRRRVFLERNLRPRRWGENSTCRCASSRLRRMSAQATQ